MAGIQSGSPGSWSQPVEPGLKPKPYDVGCRQLHPQSRLLSHTLHPEAKLEVPWQSPTDTELPRGLKAPSGRKIYKAQVLTMQSAKCCPVPPTLQRLRVSKCTSSLYQKHLLHHVYNISVDNGQHMESTRVTDEWSKTMGYL